MKYFVDTPIPTHSIETGVQVYVIENDKAVKKDAELLPDFQFEYLESDLLRIEINAELIATEFYYLFKTESGMEVVGISLLLDRGITVCLPGSLFLRSGKNENRPTQKH